MEKITTLDKLPLNEYGKIENIECIGNIKKKAIGFRTCKRDKDCSSFSKPSKDPRAFCSWKYNSNKKRRSTKYTNFVLPQ